MKIMIYLLILLCVGLIIRIFQFKSKNAKKKNKNSSNTAVPINQTYPDIDELRQKHYTDIESTRILDYTKSYEPKYLMTTNEKAQYRKLLQWASKHNLIVFSKVRLLDLITPRKNQENYKGALWKIQAKHVDFVICDQDIRIKVIVEINDGSHNRQDRTQRDSFVTDVLQACGYKVLMIYNITEEQLNSVCGYSQHDKISDQ